MLVRDPCSAGPVVACGLGQVAENVKDQNIYARFVRKKRPNATVDKDLYRA